MSSDIEQRLAAMTANDAKRLLWGICEEMNDYFEGRAQMGATRHARPLAKVQRILRDNGLLREPDHADE